MSNNKKINDLLFNSLHNPLYIFPWEESYPFFDWKISVLCGCLFLLSNELKKAKPFRLILDEKIKSAILNYESMSAGKKIDKSKYTNSIMLGTLCANIYRSFYLDELQNISCYDFDKMISDFFLIIPKDINDKKISENERIFDYLKYFFKFSNNQFLKEETQVNGNFDINKIKTVVKSLDLLKFKDKQPLNFLNIVDADFWNHENNIITLLNFFLKYSDKFIKNDSDIASVTVKNIADYTSGIIEDIRQLSEKKSKLTDHTLLKFKKLLEQQNNYFIWNVHLFSSRLLFELRQNPVSKKLTMKELKSILNWLKFYIYSEEKNGKSLKIIFNDLENQ